MYTDDQSRRLVNSINSRFWSVWISMATILLGAMLFGAIAIRFVLFFWGATLDFANPDLVALMVWKVLYDPFFTTACALVISGFFWAYIYFLLFLYACWRVLPQSESRIKPLGAVLPLLVPLFNIAWIYVGIYRLAKNLNESLHLLGNPIRVSSRTALWMIICLILQWVPVAGVFAAFAAFILWCAFFFEARTAAIALALAWHNIPQSTSNQDSHE